MGDDVCKRQIVRYVSVPSLESIAALTVVVQLWKNTRLREELQLYWRRYYSRGRSYRYGGDANFRNIEGKIWEKLSHLFLPKLLKAKASNIVKPIGLQMLKWLDRCVEDCSHFCSIKCMDHICWTIQGTIDNTKTLELYFSNFTSLEDAYFKACKYCLEGHIYSFWKQMPEELRSISFYTYGMYMCYEHHLIAYWTCSMKKELSSLLPMITEYDRNNIYNCNHSVYKNMFTLSVSEGNTSATKYFWHKLTSKEMCDNIVQWTLMAIECRKSSEQDMYQESNEYTDIFCFLLSQMSNEELQRNVLKKYSDVILQALFLDWPWQKHLLPTIRLIWDFLDSHVYVNLLSAIVREIKRGKNSENLFKELWCISPWYFKKCFIQHMRDSEGGTEILFNLYKIEDYNTVTQLLNDVTIEDKKKIIFSTLRSKQLFELIYAEQFSSFKMLMEEILSENEIGDFKSNLMVQWGNELCRFWIRDNNWQPVENLLEWCFASEDEINSFKKEKINKFAIFRSLACVGDYELIDRFMNWCFSSNEEILQFKKGYCSVYNHKFMKKVIVEFGFYDSGWDLFEKLISYCFSCEEEISEFKKLFTYRVMASMIQDIIICAYNFQFSRQLLVWRFSSEKEIDEFKRELILSPWGVEMFVIFASNYKVCESGYSNWELVKKLTKWCYPSIKEVIIEFKKTLRENYLAFNALEAKAINWKSLSYLLDNLMRDSNSSDDNDEDSFTNARSKVTGNKSDKHDASHDVEMECIFSDDSESMGDDDYTTSDDDSDIDYNEEILNTAENMV